MNQQQRDSLRTYVVMLGSPFLIAKTIPYLDWLMHILMGA